MTVRWEDQYDTQSEYEYNPQSKPILSNKEKSQGFPWGIVIPIVLIIAIVVAIIYFSRKGFPGTIKQGTTNGELIPNGCNTPIDGVVSENITSGNEWTIMTWFKHEDDPNDLNQEYVVMTKGGSPKFFLDEVRFLNTFKTVLKFQWNTQGGQGLETKDNAFVSETEHNKGQSLRTVDQWKHYTWVHNNGENRFYEDGKLFYELIDPKQFRMSSGDIKFFDNTRYQKVCDRALTEDEIKNIFEQELPLFDAIKEKMKNLLRKESLEEKKNLVDIGLQ